MKHIRKFNESVYNVQDELTEFTNNSLAYLIDDGINIIVENWNTVTEEYRILLMVWPIGHGKTKWDNMKDDVIPFLTVLNTRYNLITVKIAYTNNEDADAFDETIVRFDKNTLKEIEKFNTDYVKRVVIFVKPLV